MAEHVITTTRRRSVGSNPAVVERGAWPCSSSKSSRRRQPCQRDVIDWTLITAAARSGQTDYASEWVSEPVQPKPAASSPAEQLLIANGMSCAAVSAGWRCV